MAEIKRISKVNVSNAVFEQMKAQIFDGDWPPGSRIPSENDLGKMFGVSRISVRSALQKLNILGLVNTKQGEGTFVSDLTAEVYFNSLLPVFALGKHDLIDVLEFRRAYEIANARLAALRRTEKDLEDLNSTLKKMQDCKADIKRFSKEDLNFHLELARATKNALIVKVSQITKDILLSNMIEIITYQGTEDGLIYHPQILEAVTKRDSELAAQIMTEHIDLTIKVILEKYPEE